jgi:eukaryotic-like serine/threonine-protein kinase
MTASVSVSRWKQIEDLFQTASDLEPCRRMAFLHEACGSDAELRNEVEALLAASHKTLGLLKRRVDEAAADLRGAALETCRLGAYRVIRLLSEGGMANVYLGARADDEYEQTVAIKVMCGALWNTRALLPRFRTERQILANLSHPNIAHLLDAGVTADGIPYLVMEFVDGIPIDEYCRRNRLTIEAILRLFVGVCSAVEYAHKNLIIHRDIKPGNILVTATGTPKLLDFGIAKLMDAAEATPHLARTRPTERLLTPEYASPEQILGEPVTTATDVYGLGGLLYQLLSGRSPFSGRFRSPHELARQICETEPDAPSAARAQATRPPDPSAVRTLKGDLDHIVLMAMRKEPARRYSSVEQLTVDIAAYLDGFPVMASNDTFAYRAGKFLKRHRLGVAAATIASVALIGVVVGMAVLSGRASRERLKAERQAIFLADMFRAASPHVARGRTVAARDLLDEGARRIDRELAEEPEVRASLLRTIAAAYYSLGSYDDAQRMAERSHAVLVQTVGGDHPSAADALLLVARVMNSKGQYEKAESLFRKVLEVRRRTLAPGDPALAQSLTLLGACLSEQHKDQEAEAMLQQALPIYRSHGANTGVDTREVLAALLERRGDYQEAMTLMHESIEITRRVEGTNTPTYATSLNNLARTLISAGNYWEAESKLRESLAIHRNVHAGGHPALYTPVNNLTAVLLQQGRWAEAEPLLRDLDPHNRALDPRHPYHTTTLLNWAALRHADARFAEADAFLRKALALTNDRERAASITLTLGAVELDRGRRAEALKLDARALEMYTELKGEHSPAVASALIELSEARLSIGDHTGAGSVARRAVEIRRSRLPPDHPNITRAEVQLGRALVAQGMAAEAEPLLKRAVQFVRNPPFRLPSWHVGEAEAALGWCLGELGRTSEAETLLRAAHGKLMTHPRPRDRGEADRRLETFR